MATKIATTVDRYPTDDMFGETIQVIVGENTFRFGELSRFTLHAGVVSFYSGFFASALKYGTFKEGSERVVRLPDENIERFRKFVAFISLRENYKTKPADFRSLIELYVLSDRYMAPLLANVAMDLLVAKCTSENQLPTRELDFAYENTTQNAPLRRGLATMIALAWNGLLIAEAMYGGGMPWPFDVLAGVFVAQHAHLALVTSTTVLGLKARCAKLKRCEFHTHDEGEECP